MPQVHRGAIIDVKFNTKGTHLCSVGMGDSYNPAYTLCVYADRTRSPVVREGVVVVCTLEY